MPTASPNSADAAAGPPAESGERIKLVNVSLWTQPSRPPPAAPLSRTPSRATKPRRPVLPVPISPDRTQLAARTSRRRRAEAGQSLTTPKTWNSSAHDSHCASWWPRAASAGSECVQSCRHPGSWINAAWCCCWPIPVRPEYPRIQLLARARPAARARDDLPCIVPRCGDGGTWTWRHLTFLRNAGGGAPD